MPSFSEEAAHRLGDELRVALLAEPPLLPHVVVALPGAPVVVDEVIGDRVGPLEFRDDIPIPHEEGGRPVAEPHLVEVGGFRLPFVRGGDEDVLPASPLRDLEGGEESRRPGAERRGEVRGDHVVPEVQGGLQDARVLAVGEGQRRRTEVTAVDRPFVLPGQAVPGGGDRHRQAVLVVVAHGALPLGDHDDGRGEPAHRLEDRHPVEPQAGDVGAVGSDSDHNCPSSLSSRAAGFLPCCVALCGLLRLRGEGGEHVAHEVVQLPQFLRPLRLKIFSQAAPTSSTVGIFFPSPITVPGLVITAARL